MTAIAADDAFAPGREAVTTAPLRTRLRAIRTELTMMITGFVLVVFATAYGLGHL